MENLEIKELVQDVFLNCEEKTRVNIKNALELEQLTCELLTTKLTHESYFLKTVQAFICMDKAHKEEKIELENKITQAKKTKTEKTALQELTSSAIGYGLLSVYGLQDMDYSNMQLGISNYIVRQALNSTQKANAVDNLRQFSGRALAVLEGIKHLEHISIDYDKLSKLIALVNDKDIVKGKFTDAARDKVNSEIKKIGFEVSLKTDKDENEADKE